MPAAVPISHLALADGRGIAVKTKLKFAMVQDIVVAYQIIARHAAQGKDLDAYLRMMADEADEGRTPISARFVFAPDTPEPLREGEEAPARAAASSRPNQGHQSRCLAAGRS